MFVKENTLSAIKEYFFDSLAQKYPNQEVNSFFGILCSHFLGFSKSDLILKKDAHLSESELLNFHYAVKDLVQFKPIQFITGTQFFYNHEFKVNSHTLIPRPETEELVDIIVKENNDFRGKILDVGTGTGAIAISLDLAMKQAKVTAFDVSNEALTTAKENGKLLSSQVNFEFQDILNPVYTGEKFGIIVSNPPYVLNSEKQLMQPNVLNYEPHLALFVDDSDPLLFYKNIVRFCQSHLIDGGKLYVEINEKYGQETYDLLVKNGFSEVEIIRDMQGKDRIVKGSKK